MSQSFVRYCRAAALAVLLVLAGACSLGAQDWTSATEMPGVDLAGLKPQQKAEALKILREHACGCGCPMKVAQCRFEDPKCMYSTGLAQVIVEQIRAGKTEAEALAAADASRFSHRPERKLLDDPVKIPTAGSPSIGPDNAPITLVEFSDFQCPYCAQATPQIEGVVKLYPTNVKLVFKQFPLDFHPHAELAAEASLAAQKQGKFWPMHDALFASRDNLTRQNILAIAQSNGLDVKQFSADWDSAALRETVARDIQDGNQAGVEGTPTIFINGQKYNGVIDVSFLQPIIDDQLKKTTTALVR